MLSRIFSLFRRQRNESAVAQTESTKDIEALRQRAEEKLGEFRQTLEHLSGEADYVPAEARAGAVHLLDQAKQQLLHLEEEWEVLSTQPEPSEKALQALIAKISHTRKSLSILVQRGIHRRNLNRLKEQLAMRQSALTRDELQVTLQPQISREQEEVQSLEAKEKLDSHEQEVLAIHRRNLELYQQMLAGERPYAPMYLLNQVIYEEQALGKIDADLARL
jgi:DNA polymerase sigma